jgi:hypothetical protein
MIIKTKTNMYLTCLKGDVPKRNYMQNCDDSMFGNAVVLTIPHMPSEFHDISKFQ